MEQFNIEWKDIASVKPYARNAKKHDDKQVANVAESIKQFGWQQPIVCDADGVIIIGHCRLLAAKKLGLKKVPVKTVDNLSEEQVKKLRALDNKLNESEWDFDLLAEDIGELDFSGFDIDWGLPEDEEEKEIIEDEPPEVDEENEPITQLGDIWQLGKHRLMCGDSTDALNINILMQGEKADLVFTDPPYGMKKEKDGVANDNLNYDDLLEFNKQWIPLSFDALKDNGSWYCWGIDEPLMDIYSEILKPMIRANKITFRNLIVWDKGDAGAGGVSFMGKDGLRSYPISDEKCLFIMCGVQGFNNNADNYFEKYEPIRGWLENEAKKSNIDAKKIKQICGVGMYSHWFTKSQWDLMTEDNYKKIQSYCVKNNINAFGVEYGKIKEEYQKIKEEWYSTRAYFDNTHDNMKTVWNFERVKGEERAECSGHATPKPIALCSRAIKSSSRENEIVLDLFGGSGSTLIACEQLKRKAYLMELEPKWCDVIIKRWENLTGEKAVKIS